MMQIIDQRWRDHLAEMDYLREGINLRAMGQQDPLVAWQREGFSIFGQMMDAIDDDYLRYVMHVQVVAEPAPEPDLSHASYQAADDPVQGASLLEAMRASVPPPEVAAAGAGVPIGLDEGGISVPGGQVSPRHQADGETQAPLVKAPTEKIGRNEPCWCGSGKKFKLCHGAA
jgi:preprotein translocase subunit SecA